MDAVRGCLVRALTALVLLGAVVLPVRAASADTLVGDVNGDCAVNVLDLSKIAASYLTGVGSLLYSPALDFDHNGVINILDVQVVAAHYGQHC